LQRRQVYAVCAGLTALRAPEPIIPAFENFKRWWL
jgi:hypothetical protein